jgi:hypothetical protein
VSGARIGIGVLCRAPRPGEGKSRLAASEGAIRAAALARAFLIDVGHVVAEAADGLDAACFAFVRPPDALDEVAGLLPAGFTLAPQQAGDLGAVMSAALEAMLAHCPGGAVLVGSDLPTLPPSRLVDACAALGEPGVDAVFGPAEDGGYFLAGVRGARAPPLFAPLAWGGSEVMATTRRRAAAAGLVLREIDPWYDVDDARGLARLRDDLRVRPSAPARATRAVLGP